MERLKTIYDKNKVLWKKIIKCTIAYEICSIITLIPQINETITVSYLMTLGALFFNPSTTAGFQVIEMSLNFCLMVSTAIYCAIIVYLCTLYNSHIESASLYSNGAGIICAIAFFLSTWVIAFLRLKYPRLFVPTLQGFVVTFFCLTSVNIYSTQFNFMSIVGIFYPTLSGGVIALIVNLCLWPETAAKASEKSFGDALSSIQDVLKVTECQVLKECDDVVYNDLKASKSLRQSIQTLDGNIAKMQTARKEAKYEIVVSHYCPAWYKSISQTLEGLSRNLYGYYLSVEREGQVFLCQTNIDQQRDSEDTSKEEEQIVRFRQDQLKRNQDAKISKEADIIKLATSNKIAAANGKTVTKIEYNFINKLQSSVQPEIRNFIQICTKVILCIRHRLQDNDAIPKAEKSATMPASCPDHTHQLDLSEAMASLDRAKTNLQQEYESRRAVPTEDHFLIYTVIFSLTQFGKKLVELEQEADRLIAKRTTKRFPRVFLPETTTWKKWLGRAGESARGDRNATEQVLFDQQSLLQRERTKSETSSINTTVSPSSSATLDHKSEEEGRNSNTKSATKDSIEQRLSVESDWIDDDQQVIPLQNAPGTHIWNHWIFAFNKWTQTDPVRYAIKFTITMELLALMAWLPIPGVNLLYNNNHGQWGLLSAMVVFNFTVGSTALQCFFRVFATIIGAVAGYICLLAADRNERPYLIAILTLVFQVPMWYMMLGSKYPRMGFISLLTLAVINSTGYTDRYDEDLFAPVWKRTITAIFAILAVLIVDQLFWPVWVREMARLNLSNLLIATGIQFSKVASLVCQENTESHRYISTLRDAQTNMKILKRQHQVTSQMLALADMEPRVTKGAFPIQVYRDILEHEYHLLYWIEHLIVAQAFVSKDVRKKIMTPMNPYRKELAAAVHLYLFTLACSLRTKSSLPASLPSAEIARKMLQQRQAILWHEHYDELCCTDAGDGNGVIMIADDSSASAEKRREERSANNQIYWQTYAAGSVEVIVEQEEMGALVAKLMGQHVFKAATRDWII